ncbi:MAG: DUF1853 family protein [Natronospirillum sp.]
MTDTTTSIASITRDLAWAINSAEPCALPGILPWQEHGDWFSEWLQGPQPFTVESLASWRDRRLGKYFEALWQCYLNAHPDWTLRLSHHPVYVARQTIGELDFVLENRHTHALWHLELAVKFFLYMPEPGMPCTSVLPSANELKHWVGPSLQDSLARKYHHLMHQQLPLGQHPSIASTLMHRPDQSHAVVKGRFFVPADPQWPSAQPQWMTWKEAQQLPPTCEVWPLSRGEWLTGTQDSAYSTDQSLPCADWLRSLAGPTVPAPQPRMLQLREEPGGERVWRFLVPDSWPDRARAMINQCDPITGQVRPSGNSMENS